MEEPLYEACFGLLLGIAVAKESPSQLVKPLGEVLLENVLVKKAAQKARFPGWLLASSDDDVAEGAGAILVSRAAKLDAGAGIAQHHLKALLGLQMVQVALKDRHLNGLEHLPVLEEDGAAVRFEVPLGDGRPVDGHVLAADLPGGALRPDDAQGHPQALAGVGLVNVKGERARHVVVQHRDLGPRHPQAQRGDPWLLAAHRGGLEEPDVEVLVPLPGLVVDDPDLHRPRRLRRLKGELALGVAVAHALARRALLRAVGHLHAAARGAVRRHAELERARALEDRGLRLLEADDAAIAAAAASGAQDAPHHGRADLRPAGARGHGHFAPLLEHEGQGLRGQLLAVALLDALGLPLDPGEPPVLDRQRQLVTAAAAALPEALVHDEREEDEQGEHGERDGGLPALHQVGRDQNEDDQQPGVREYRERGCDGKDAKTLDLPRLRRRDCGNADGTDDEEVEGRAANNGGWP
mmetsp:Transcript_21215/g.59997  ORF Transcript_21215/g.59997 Transcript_21215/m.59997 type:complete len:467 (+) Transcript_21215:712-2112(+)